MRESNPGGQTSEELPERMTEDRECMIFAIKPNQPHKDRLSLSTHLLSLQTLDMLGEIAKPEIRFRAVAAAEIAKNIAPNRHVFRAVGC